MVGQMKPCPSTRTVIDAAGEKEVNKIKNGSRLASLG